MKPQLYVGGREPSPDLFKPVKNSDQCLGAKPEGGLWTSTYDPDYGSDWVRWCIGEDFEVPHGGWKYWLLTPKSHLIIEHIDGPTALAGLLQQFGRDPYPDMSVRSLKPDFEKLAEWRFDAIHLTEEGQWNTRHSVPHDLYGWDCESTLWLNWAFEKVEYLGVCTWQERAQREIGSMIAD